MTGSGDTALPPSVFDGKRFSVGHIVPGDGFPTQCKRKLAFVGEREGTLLSVDVAIILADFRAGNGFYLFLFLAAGNEDPEGASYGEQNREDQPQFAFHDNTPYVKSFFIISLEKTGCQAKPVFLV